MADSRPSYSTPVLQPISAGGLAAPGLLSDPHRPESQLSGNQVYPSYGLRDSEREPDGYVTFSWVHTFNPNLLLTVSPFYHYNQAAYNSGPNDVPVISTVHQTANYAGAQASLNITALKNNDLQVGVYGFAQHQNNYFNNVLRIAPRVVRTSARLRLR
jgi:hypothetical protein